MAARLTNEAAVTAQWRSLPYHGFGICPGCGRSRYGCGPNPQSRVCLVCFEFEFNCKPPNFRRRQR